MTLIEVMIAAMTLLLLTLGIMITLVPVRRQNQVSREMGQVTMEAERVLERLLAVPFSDLTVTYPQDTVLPISTVPNGEARIHYEDPAANPLTIELNVLWQSPDSGAMSRRFVTARAN